MSPRARRSGLALLLAALTVQGAALAHPLGLSSINRYAGIRLHTREVEVDYLVDFAEMPAWTEIESLDANHDGAVTPAERDAYVQGLVSRVLPTLSLEVDGVQTPLREVFHGIEAPQGQNGLSTLRVAIEFRAALPDALGSRCSVRLRDGFQSGRGGWRELGAESSPEGRVVSSTLPDGPRAGAALSYPMDPDNPGSSTVRPPRIDDATFVFDRSAASMGAGGASVRPGVAHGERHGATSDGARLVALLRDPHRSPWFVLFALAVAFALGAGHALSPGHGKTLVAAWLVGARGRPRHALILGATVTVAHTASVFVLGVFALVIEQYVGSDKLLRALELASGALVAGIALSQLPARVKRMRGQESARDTTHDHDHGHAHDHDHGHEHDHGHGRAEPRAHEHEHEHEHDHGHDHDHGHSHLPPEEISTRSLIALGVSGGIVPCPGALVVLLAAIGMHRVAFGLALLVAFSLGLAAVLTAIGLAFVMARQRFERISTEGALFRVLPVISSCAVFALGVVLVVKALMR